MNEAQNPGRLHADASRQDLVDVSARSQRHLARYPQVREQNAARAEQERKRKLEFKLESSKRQAAELLKSQGWTLTPPNPNAAITQS
eukprot:6206620-Pleurochrysis_carterae.AAC.1